MNFTRKNSMSLIWLFFPLHPSVIINFCLIKIHFIFFFLRVCVLLLWLISVCLFVLRCIVLIDVGANVCDLVIGFCCNWFWFEWLIRFQLSSWVLVLPTSWYLLVLRSSNSNVTPLSLVIVDLLLRKCECVRISV